MHSILNEQISLHEGSPSRKISKAEAILRRLIIGGLKGDTRDLHALFRLAEQTGQFEEPRDEITKIERVVFQHRVRSRPRRAFQRGAAPSEQAIQQGLEGGRSRVREKGIYSLLLSFSLPYSQRVIFLAFAAGKTISNLELARLPLYSLVGYDDSCEYQFDYCGAWPKSKSRSERREGWPPERRVL